MWAISGCVLFAFIGLRLGFVRGCVFCIIGTLVLLAGVVLSPVKDLPDVWLRLTMYGFILLLAVFAGYFVDSYIRRDFIQQRLLAAERAKSDRLLFNLLPRPIADRLRETPGTIADTHAEVSVVFADLVGFTALSTRVSPTAMVETLNTIFSAFDRLAERLGLEKIKTTGDGYHAVAGLPSPRPDHAEAAAELALGMHATIDHIARQTGWDLRLRVGIASGGPVVAGVIGQTKYVYEVWGDVVNTASRMESHGLPGAIQVTEETRRRLDGRYAFIDRGLIEVKNKGPLHTYFLQRRDAAEADDGRLPELTAAHGRAVR